MDTNKLKKFAQEARTQLIAQVSAKLKLVLAEGSAARREAPSAVQELLGEIRSTSEAQVIEKVAYTWFNRFTALRFMDANGYTVPRVVTPADGQTRPELLADAAAGVFVDGVSSSLSGSVSALLDGRTPSRDPQGEAYRQLLVAACNEWHKHMPFMFEKISDYTELLMPDDLLSQESILSRMRAVMTDEDCHDVEIIGWLYQFYISEKKDQVFAALKKNVKITAENIPAATQLFTPHWIVRYLVENSLGRLWLLNRPGSKLAAQMDYYIAPEEPETDFLKIGKPEEIKICDPACGSGHMLTYAFDLLHAIYEEEGYDATEIPALILTHNLTGIEIDDRAGALAAFALTMKTASKLGRRRFLRLEVRPDIVVLKNATFTSAELTDVAAVVGKDLFTTDLREALTQFEQAKNFGSLIVPHLRDPAETLRRVEARDFSSDLLLKEMQARVVSVLMMAEALSRKYHVVIANPPYMGSGSMNSALSQFAARHFSNGKQDLFAMFMLRCLDMLKSGGWFGMINLPSWLFLSSFSNLRRVLLERSEIRTLAHMGRGVFGVDWGSTAFVVSTAKRPNAFGDYFRLHKKNFQLLYPDDIREIFLASKENRSFRYSFDEYDPEKPLDRKSLPTDVGGEQIHFSAKANSFQSLPGLQIAYWIKNPELFSGETLKEYYTSGGRTKTHDNSTYLRYSWEVSTASGRWAPYANGGDFRKYRGNDQYLVDWSAEARDFYESHGGLASPQFYNKTGICWSLIAASKVSFRIKTSDQHYSSGSPTIFGNGEINDSLIISFLNSNVASYFISAINPTVNTTVNDVLSLPVRNFVEMQISNTSFYRCQEISQDDWDENELARAFGSLPLISRSHRAATLAGSFKNLRTHWQAATEELLRLEIENNRIFIDAYGLSDALTPDVPLDEITLNCNPAYRYGSSLSNDEREARLLADTMAEFLHYAVGCMFGRYSLDRPGLILANQGDGLADYLAQVPEPSFMPDEDNVIPVLDGDWFADDITERFRKFLRVTFGEEKFQENLAFIESALGKDIRKWFTTSFFDYHVRRYKKRPIYWMFSSPKGSFNALIYMHRYRSDTVSVLLNDYLREFISKLQAERIRLEKLADDPSASQSQKTKALKDVGTIIKQIDELTDWERDVMFPLAQSKIEIDLDDGVKRNYPKFGSALKAIKGLEASDDE